ncbi:hypothetical protein REPUB_Repub07fG0071700 [Reevesia pubescens]
MKTGMDGKIDEKNDDIDFDEVVSDDEMEGRDDRWPSVSFTKKEKEHIGKPWRKTLIVKLLGKALRLQTLNCHNYKPMATSG